MTLYTVTIYDLRIDMKEVNSGPKIFKWDGSREIIICAGQGYPLWSSSSFTYTMNLGKSVQSLAMYCELGTIQRIVKATFHKNISPCVLKISK